VTSQLPQDEVNLNCLHICSFSEVTSQLPQDESVHISLKSCTLIAYGLVVVAG